MKLIMLSDDSPVIPPPANAQVDYERKPILYRPDGIPLVKKPMGFDTTSKTWGNSHEVV